MAGIDGQQAAIGLGRLLEPMHPEQRKALVEQHLDKVGPERERLVEPRQRFVITAQPEQSVADIVAGRGIGRIERMRAAGIGQALLISLQAAQHARAHLQGRGMIRP
jgi:hypothetical protein